MRWYNSSIGKKFIMGLTGALMVLFIIAHMLGNLTIFAGPNGLDAYAEHLRTIPPLLWIFRAVMLCALVLHVWTGFSLYLENKAARPVGYQMKQNQKTTFSAENMIWTGLLLLVFIVYHLLQVTFHATNPTTYGFMDAAGRPDVFKMVVLNLQHFGIAAVYAAAMIVLLLHLRHGVQSLFQSLGLTNDSTLPKLETGGRWTAGILMLGFILIPITIFFGVVKL